MLAIFTIGQTLKLLARQSPTEVSEFALGVCLNKGLRIRSCVRIFLYVALTPHAFLMFWEVAPYYFLSNFYTLPGGHLQRLAEPATVDCVGNYPVRIDKTWDTGEVAGP